MAVEVGNVVGVYFRVTEENGQLVDETAEGFPFVFKVGSGEVIKGIEENVLGMEVGEEKDFTLSPEEAFGPYREDLVKDLPLELFPGDVKVGQVFKTSDLEGNPVFFKVKEIKDGNVIADFNHPLAGKTLNFHLKVVFVE